MQYTNVVVPLDSALMMSGDGISEVVRAIIGHDCPISYDVGDFPTSGSSGIGPWEEGDVVFVDEGRTYMLSYDFIPLYDENIGRIFRYAVYETDTEED